MVMWLFGREPLTLGHQSANFSGFRCYSGRDKTFFICHLISKDTVFKGLCDFMGQSSLKYITTLPLLEP